VERPIDFVPSRKMTYFSAKWNTMPTRKVYKPAGFRVHIKNIISYLRHVSSLGMWFD